jgi:hypothetical protein
MNGDIYLAPTRDTCGKGETTQRGTGSASRNLGNTTKYIVTAAKSDFTAVNPHIAAARARSATSVYHRVASAGTIRVGDTRFAERHGRAVI